VLDLARLSHKHRIIDFFRYVDDILLIFDPKLTDIPSILTAFNTLHSSLHFTAETERDNAINYLNISIRKTPPQLNNFCLQKTHLHVLPYTCNHPTQHKYAAVKLLYRLKLYGLQEQEYKHKPYIITLFKFHNRNTHTTIQQDYN
jgi:hypothetical protein